MKVGFERIDPTPDYPAEASAHALIGAAWDSEIAVVKHFKAYLKPELRKLQLARCCFCRRLLYDDYAAHLEHFIDKAQYGVFTFEIKNLALSCGTCNGKKNGFFRKLSTRLKQSAKLSGKAFTSRCPVLTTELLAGMPFPNTEDAFRWVNPHIDEYSKHIQLTRGWVFQAKTRKGSRTIRGVKLNEIASIEQRALAERFETRGGKLSMLVGMIAELNHHRAKEVATAVAKIIARRKAAAAKL
jgi:uncharacterized protein (TIGR02646 family)